MSVVKRGKVWYAKFRPFEDQLQLALKGCETKRQAGDIQKELLYALRSKDYSSLSKLARIACINLFNNQEWALPPELQPEHIKPPERVLTLGDAFGYFAMSDTYKTAKYPDRYRICIDHLEGFFKETYPVKDLWTPQIREYRVKRQTEDAQAATINREVGTLSRIFQVLIDHRLVEVNPCRLVERLSEKGGQREVYISYTDFVTMVNQTWEWFRPIMWAAYLSGMRRGEIISLERKDVDTNSRIIKLTPDRTKEFKFKRVPIHKDLLPFLESKIHNINTDRVFLKNGQPLTPYDFRHPWRLATKGMDQRLRFHDVRAVFITNCRRSGISEAVEQAIVGHADRLRPITQRYGRVSDQELLNGIDKLVTDHGSTEVLTAVSG